jgi:hypothetical protein
MYSFSDTIRFASFFLVACLTVVVVAAVRFFDQQLLLLSSIVCGTRPSLPVPAPTVSTTIVMIVIVMIVMIVIVMIVMTAAAVVPQGLVLGSVSIAQTPQMEIEFGHES